MRTTDSRQTLDDEIWAAINETGLLSIEQIKNGWVLLSADLQAARARIRELSGEVPPALPISALCLAKARHALTMYYDRAGLTGDHRMIEFAGLISKYLTLARRALQTENRDHVEDGLLPMEDFDAAYLGEKFHCIFGSAFRNRPELIDTFCDGAFSWRPKRAACSVHKKPFITVCEQCWDDYYATSRNVDSYEQAQALNLLDADDKAFIASMRSTHPGHRLLAILDKLTSGRVNAERVHKAPNGTETWEVPPASGEPEQS